MVLAVSRGLRSSKVSSQVRDPPSVPSGDRSIFYASLIARRAFVGRPGLRRRGPRATGSCSLARAPIFLLDLSSRSTVLLVLVLGHRQRQSASPPRWLSGNRSRFPPAPASRPFLFQKFGRALFPTILRAAIAPTESAFEQLGLPAPDFLNSREADTGLIMDPAVTFLLVGVPPRCAKRLPFAFCPLPLKSKSRWVGLVLNGLCACLRDREPSPWSSASHFPTFPW